jgi:hypothetical protein
MRNPFWRSRNPGIAFLTALAGLVDSLITIFTLGFFGTNFAFKVLADLELRRLNRMARQKND